MEKEIDNLLEDLDSGEEVKTKYGVCYVYSPDIVEQLKQALTELKQIKEAQPSEAIECLDKMVRDFNETTTGMNGLGEVVVGNELVYFHKKELETIKQALLNAQELEKKNDRLENQCLNLLGESFTFTRTLDAILGKFIWVENGVLYAGRINDIEIPLDEEDFEDQQEIDFLKRWASAWK